MGFSNLKHDLHRVMDVDHHEHSPKNHTRRCSQRRVLIPIVHYTFQMWINPALMIAARAALASCPPRADGCYERDLPSPPHVFVLCLVFHSLLVYAHVGTRAALLFTVGNSSGVHDGGK